MGRKHQYHGCQFTQLSKTVTLLLCSRFRKQSTWHKQFVLRVTFYLKRKKCCIFFPYHCMFSCLNNLTELSWLIKQGVEQNLQVELHPIGSFLPTMERKMYVPSTNIVFFSVFHKDFPNFYTHRYVRITIKGLYLYCIWTFTITQIM